MPRAAVIAIWAIATQACAAAQVADELSVHAYLAERLQDNGPLEFRTAETDLNGDGKKEIVVHMGGDYCGSGGCNTYVLERTGRGYRTVLRATVTRPPIRVLSTVHHGWRDIGVRVRGGGILQGYEAAFAFDGSSYPSNPTIAPAKRVDHAEGVVLIGQ